MEDISEGLVLYGCDGTGGVMKQMVGYLWQHDLAMAHELGSRNKKAKDGGLEEGPETSR